VIRVAKSAHTLRDISLSTCNKVVIIGDPRYFSTAVPCADTGSICVSGGVWNWWTLQGQPPVLGGPRSTDGARTTSSGVSRANVVSGPMEISERACGRSPGAVITGLMRVLGPM
jgi:hypothetical protein